MVAQSVLGIKERRRKRSFNLFVGSGYGNFGPAPKIVVINVNGGNGVNVINISL